MVSAGYGELFGSDYCDAFYIQAKLSTRNKGKAQWFSGKVDRPTMAKSIPRPLLFLFNKYYLLGGKDNPPGILAAWLNAGLLFRR